MDYIASLGGLGFGYLFGSSHSTKTVITHVVGDYDGCGDCSQLVKDVAWKLDNKSYEWGQDNFAVYAGNIYVWYIDAPQIIELSRGENGMRITLTEDEKALLERAAKRMLVKTMSKE